MDLLEPIWIPYCAYLESLKKSERVAAAWDSARKAAEGRPIPAKRPGWIRRQADGYARDEAHAATASRWCARGFQRIAAQIRSENGPTIGPIAPWDPDYIRRHGPPPLMQEQMSCCLRCATALSAVETAELIC